MGATVLAAKGSNRDPLSEAGLGEDEEVGSRLHNCRGHHKVSLSSEADANDAASGASHRARLLLMEAADATLSRGKNNVVFTRCWDHLCELIALIKSDRDDSRRAHLLKLLERRLLDDPLLRGEGEVATCAEVLQDHRCNRDFPGLNLHARKIDDWDPLVLTRRVWNLVHLRAEAATLVGEEEGPVVRVRNLE